MKIAVVAANGRAGSTIVKEAVSRGHEVTAFLREDGETAAQHKVIRDIFDITKEDLADFDAVVNPFGVWQPELLHLHLDVAKHLVSVLSGTKTRLVSVGGTGSMYVDDSLTTRLVDQPTFSPEFKPLALAMGEALDYLRGQDEVSWTTISPAANFMFDAPRTGTYKVGGEVFFTDEHGRSEISYADYAIAMIDEIERGDHINTRIGVIKG